MSEYIAQETTKAIGILLCNYRTYSISGKERMAPAGKENNICVYKFRIHGVKPTRTRGTEFCAK